MSAIGLEDWMEEHGDYLLRYARHRVSDRAAGEDLVQDTYLAAWKAWDKFEGRSSIKTWMTSILRRKIIDYYHRTRRERALFPQREVEEGREYDEEAQSQVPLEVMPAFSSRWSGDAAERAEFWEALRSSLEGLPEKQRDIFVRKELEGLSTEEVCALNQVTPNHLWVILHRARKGLRRSLERRGFSPGQILGAGFCS